MKNTIQQFPIIATASPGWLPAMVCGCLMAAGFLIAAATAADMIGW